MIGVSPVPHARLREQCCGVVAWLGDVTHQPVVRLLWDSESARMKPVELDTSVERVRIRGALRHGERESAAAEERLGESVILI